MQCHRQEKTGLPFSDTADAAGSGTTTHPGSYVKVGQYHETISFPSHPHGNMFLNSPHGEFTGNFNEIPTATYGNGYGSYFQNEAEALSTGNGCTGCHNVHRSTVPEAATEEAVKECQDCHKGQFAVDLTKINHLAGAGTPLEKMNTEPSEPCIICHMPAGVHMWRVNADASYSTFPSSVFTSSTYANATVAPEGTFTNAVWVDLDLSCGQCHGGGNAHATTTGGITSGTKVLTVANATGFAQGARVSIANAALSGGQPAAWETYVGSVSGTTVTLVGKAGNTVAGAAVVVNPTANGGLYRTKAALATVAKGMHDNAGLAATVTFTYATSGLTANVTAQVTCGAAPCPAFKYDWSWGDGSTTLGAGAVASHAYATAGAKTITLTVKLDSTNANNTQVGTATRTVTVTAPDLPPTALSTCTWNSNTWTMTVLDRSTDTDATGVRTVIVEWGDGSLRSTGAAGATFTHVYITPGSYPVTLKAIDSASKVSTPLAFCQAPNLATPGYFTISGRVLSKGGTPLASASVTLQKVVGVTPVSVKTVLTVTNGTFTHGSLKPGTYQLTVVKSGYTFNVPAAGSLVVGGSMDVGDINATAPNQPVLLGSDR
jgi:predicted CXXCH cytochrome family protein